MGWFIYHKEVLYGPGDQDVPYAHVTQHKTVSVAAFYMDKQKLQTTNIVSLCIGF